MRKGVGRAQLKHIRISSWLPVSGRSHRQVPKLTVFLRLLTDWKAPPLGWAHIFAFSGLESVFVNTNVITTPGRSNS